MADIMKSVRFMIETANDNSHGYDQSKRNGPDYDCSSLVATALYEGGFKVSPNSWTGNLESQLRACGFADCKKPWKAGDIHLNRKHHVCMSINSADIAQASINEKGEVVGGKTGDQTGNEINIKPYYEYRLGWDCHLRYIGAQTDVNPNYSIGTIAKQVIAGKWGNGETRKKLLTNAGYNYNDVQKKVNEILNGKHTKSNEEIAREVIAGKWGNGETRKNKLQSAGYNYSDIQKIVNQMMK